MNNVELAKLLGPLLTMAGRERLRPLITGQTTDVILRYEEVKDWGALSDLLVERVDDLQLYDGAEWVTIQMEELKDGIKNSG